MLSCRQGAGGQDPFRPSAFNYMLSCCQGACIRLASHPDSGLMQSCGSCSIDFQMRGWPVSRSPGPKSIWRLLVVRVEVQEPSGTVVVVSVHGHGKESQQECLVHIHQGPAREFSLEVGEAHQPKGVDNCVTFTADVNVRLKRLVAG